MGLEDWVGGGVGAGLEAPVSPHPSTEVGSFSPSPAPPWRQPRNLICLWTYMGARGCQSFTQPRDTLLKDPPEASPRPSLPVGTRSCPLTDAGVPAPGSPVPCLAVPCSPARHTSDANAALPLNLPPPLSSTPAKSLRPSSPSQAVFCRSPPTCCLPTCLLAWGRPALSIFKTEIVPTRGFLPGDTLDFPAPSSLKLSPLGLRGQLPFSPRFSVSISPLRDMDLSRGCVSLFAFGT